MSEAAPTPPTKRFTFPRWVNYALPVIAVAIAGGLFYAPTLFVLGASPKTTAVGYAPEQPVPYSHAVHVGKLGMDCRYCHTTVESAAFAAIPATQTCMNCHRPAAEDDKGKVKVGTGGIRSIIKAGGTDVANPALKPLHDSWKTGAPVQWVKVHDLPDYAFFNHSAHVNRGVGCVSCHGRIDQMDKVYQSKPLSMGWCLDCHREPEKELRPLDQITNMGWKAVDHPYAEGETDAAKAQLKVGLKLKAEYGTRDIPYMTSCYTCHR